MNEKAVANRLKNFAYSSPMKVYDGLFDDLITAVTSLEEQVKISPKITKANLTGFKDFYCPKCNFRIVSSLDGEYIAGRQINYCSECGQPLKWEG